MKRWWAAAALVLACAVSVQSLLDDQAQLVTEVDHSSLDTFLDEHPTAVVEFYAPWCSVCKKLAPEVEQLASLVAEHGLDVAVAKGNANEDHILKERFDVQRTPKFIFFRNGVAHAFKTFRSGEAMFSKVLATLQPDAPPFSPAKQFSDPMKLTEWLFWRGTDGGRLEPAAVLFQPVVEERTSDELVSAFHEFAIANVLKMRFAVVTGEDVLQLFRMDPDHATVALYTEHDEGKHVFVGQPNKLGAFLLARLVPLVVPVDHITLLKVSRSTPLLVHLFVSTSDLAERKAHVLEQARTLAHHMLADGAFQRGELTIAVADGEKYQSWLQQFQMGRAALPAFAVNHVAANALFAGSASCFQQAAPGADTPHEEQLAWEIDLPQATQLVVGATVGVVTPVVPGEAEL